MTLVQLPQSVVLTFFSDLLRVSSVFYGVVCQLADDRLAARGVWDVAGIQLMSANEIVSAISVRPKRLPSWVWHMEQRITGPARPDEKKVVMTPSS